MKKLLSLFITLFALFSISPLNALANDIDIKSYYMDIDVSVDKVLGIDEDIDVYFSAPRHGIFRSIPTKGVAYRKDKKPEKYKAVLSNISVSDRYSTSYYGYNDDSYTKLRIGDAGILVEGDKNYNISYDYKLYPDKDKNADELYFNLVGNAWEIPISNFSFKITMPKDFDAKKVYFYDMNGDAKDIRYKVKDNVIEGKYLKTLYPGQPLTVHVILPEGYFDVNLIEEYAEYFKFTPFIIPLIFMLIIASFWCRYGKDEKTVEVVEYVPPEGLNPIDIAFLYKQDVSPSDVSTLLIYLANKGYLSLEQVKSGFMDSDYKITKLKEYGESDTNSRQFFNALFNGQQSVMLSDLSDTKMAAATKKIIDRASKIKNKVFEPESIKMQKITTGLMVATWVIMAIYISIMTIPFMIIHLIAFPIVGYFMLSKGISSKSVPTLLFGTMWSLITVIVLGAFIATTDASMLIIVVATLVCVIIMDIFRFYMPRWTPGANRLYGRILGFKKYLEKVEADKLQRLVDKDPKYFYNIIPYAYVFGINDKWFKKFEHITCPKPDYYVGDTFTVSVFSSTITHTMSSVTKSCTPVTQSGSSGGFSGGSFGGGGGCGGGGCGGGGGGGW